MSKTIKKDVEVEVEIEVDLEDFTNEELLEELNDRGVDVDEPELRLLRYGIEDRDWAKIEEYAQKLQVKGANIYPSPCLIERANARAQGGKG